MTVIPIFFANSPWRVSKVQISVTPINQFGSGNVQDIQRPATDGCRVIRGDGFRLPENPVPQTASDHQ